MGEVFQQPIPFVPDQKSGLDALGGASPFAHNVVIDQLGTVRRRPGIRTHRLSHTFDDPIFGLFATSAGRVFVATAPQLPGLMSIYEARPIGPLLRTAVPFHATSRPTFAETESLLLVAAGGSVQKIDLRTNTYDVLGGDPPVASHIISQSQRLLVNDLVVDRTKVAFSAPAQGTVSVEGHEQWGDQQTELGTSGFITAEGRADTIVAIAENSNEVWAFGTTTVQLFVPDNAQLFSPVTTREFGLSAAYGIIRDDQAFSWPDDKRRIVHSDGRSVSILSDPIKGTLDAMTRVDDAFGFKVYQGPTDALAWVFPSDGRTLAYQREGGWATWSGHRITAHTVIPGTNENLVGTSDGRIGEIRHGVAYDFNDPIRAEVVTGRINRDTTNRKQCQSVAFEFRRLAALVGTPRATVAWLSWRDDDGPWRTPIEIQAEQGAQQMQVVRRRSLGVYRTRQWRLQFDDREDAVLGKVIEQFKVLDT